MDLDAEMAELAQEARRRLDERAAAEREAGAIPPQVDPEFVTPLDLGGLDLGGPGLGDEAQDSAGVSLGAKVVIAVVGLVAFAVLWKTVLGSVVQGLVSLALLVLIVVATAKLIGSGNKDADEA